jgi:hypothetical protein
LFVLRFAPSAKIHKTTLWDSMMKIDESRLSGLKIVAGIILAHAMALNTYAADYSVLDRQFAVQPEVGLGYDSVLHEIRNRCITESVEDLPPADPIGPNASYRLRSFTNTQDLFSAFDINGSAGLGVGLSSTDLVFAYAASRKLSVYGSFLSVEAHAEKQVRRLQAFTLNKEAKDRLNDPAEFRAYCGDQYFSGTIEGGAFGAVLTVHSADDVEQQHIGKLLSEAARLGTLDADALRALDDKFSQHDLDITVTRRGPQEHASQGNLQALLSYAQGLPARIGDGSTKPWVIAFTKNDYGPTAIITGPAQQFHSAESAYIVQLFQYSSSLRYIQNHPAEFSAVDFVRLVKEIKNLEEEIGKVKAAAERCSRDANECGPIPHLALGQLPDRPAWVVMDPLKSTEILLGSVGAGETKAIEVRGSWYAHCDDRGKFLSVSTTGDNRLTIRNAVDNEKILFKETYRGVPMLLPADSKVWFKIIDNPTEYYDNCPDDSDRLRARVFRPLYPDLLDPLIPPP